jgi:hypothetical protein
MHGNIITSNLVERSALCMITTTTLDDDDDGDDV